jgi:4-hydroxybutyryl-CoA dehydratase/vinylacetyl-CoA-Delta-isomerase
MGLKTAGEYRDSLADLDLEAYIHGKRVEDIHEHPMVEASINALAVTYELAHDPEYEDLMVAESHLLEEPVNRFTHIHQSSEDLVTKSKMNRMLGRQTGTCFQRCVGMDALNALSIVTYDIDENEGTDYYDRFETFLKYVQSEDLVLGGTMTDVKGDRGKRPGEQTDPDMYLRVVEERDDGIVVRGAKAHQTGCVNSHELVVMPTRQMREGEEEYTVSFSIPSDTEGVRFIVGRNPNDGRQTNEETFDSGNVRYGPMEALIVFDDVFVPDERVFMNGEIEYSGDLVNTFSSYHRQSYACKAGVGDVLIGAASGLAKANGVRDASHIQSKLTEMNHLNETIYSCSLACAHEGCEMPSGTHFVDTLLSNVCKLNVTRFPYQLTRTAIDIAGGLPTTLPSEHDYRNPETHDDIEKYLQGSPDVPTETRMRLMRLVENLTQGTGAKAYLSESVHGAGSPMAQKMMIGALADMDEKEAAAHALVSDPEE